MKPWQALFCRASSKGGKEEERMDPSENPKNPNWVTKGQGNKLYSRNATGRKKHIREGKGQAWYQHW
jgi:hypothetical protein